MRLYRNDNKHPNEGLVHYVGCEKLLPHTLQPSEQNTQRISNTEHLPDHLLHERRLHHLDTDPSVRSSLSQLNLNEYITGIRIQSNATQSPKQQTPSA